MDSAEVVNLADEREGRRAAFEWVLEAHGAATEIARAWSVSRTIVYRVRDGKLPLTDARIGKMPDHLRARLRAYRAPTQLPLF